MKRVLGRFGWKDVPRHPADRARAWRAVGGAARVLRLAVSPCLHRQPARSLQPERHYFHHAVIKQVIADSQTDPIDTPTLGRLRGQRRLLILWAMSFNLLRVAGGGGLVRQPEIFLGPQYAATSAPIER